MLRSLTVQQFKSIHQSRLAFGRANLFIGPNGAGKSNVLEALGILAGALSRGLDPTSLDERGIRLSVPTLFKSSFKRTRLPATFRLEAVFDDGRYECSIRAGIRSSTLEFHSEALYDGETKVFGRGPGGISLNGNFIQSSAIRSELVDPSRGLWDIFAPLALISESLRADLDALSDFSIYAPQTAVMRGLAVDARVKSPLGLTGAGMASAFQEVVQRVQANDVNKEDIEKIIGVIWEPGWADGITIKPFDPKIVPSNVKSEGQLLYIRDRFMMKNRDYLSAFDASEGTLYLIFVATMLAHDSAPSMFGLDNVDGTLNSRLVRTLTDLIVDVACGVRRMEGSKIRRRQSFVTSHHPSSLDSFDLFEEDQAVFVVSRDTQASPKGSTKFERLRPPPGLGKAEWHERSDGKSLSTLLLENVIPGAL
ncbi:AAA family ATPase [Sphingomonas adhaesiva]|uniref:AAA family ATPase n=1 Tax=Sphingomonas adhaesiva TaxID=28212 RepID=UPI002FF87629